MGWKNFVLLTIEFVPRSISLPLSSENAPMILPKQKKRTRVTARMGRRSMANANIQCATSWVRRLIVLLQRMASLLLTLMTAWKNTGPAPAVIGDLISPRTITNGRRIAASVVVARRSLKNQPMLHLL